MMWLALQRTGLLRDGVRILHFAPERCLIARLAPRYGALYRPSDVDPERYVNPHCAVARLDLCADLPKLAAGSCELILHNHVLEHLPCSVETALMELDRILAPGGAQLFTVPFHGEETQEDVDPGLSGEERTRRFLQHDHMRMFGVRDFPRLLQRLWGSETVMLDIAAYFAETELAKAAIRPKLLSHIRGSSLFVRCRPGPSAVPLTLKAP